MTTYHLEFKAIRACLEEARSQLSESGGAGAAVTGPLLAAVLKLTGVVEELAKKGDGGRT